MTGDGGGQRREGGRERVGERELLSSILYCLQVVRQAMEEESQTVLCSRFLVPR